MASVGATFHSKICNRARVQAVIQDLIQDVYFRYIAHERAHDAAHTTPVLWAVA